MSASPLPYGRQLVDDDDIAAVVAVLKSPYLTTGPAVSAFEDAFAAATGAPHAVAVSSGTAALHLAALAAGLGVGQAAVVPALTFVATANAVRHTGAEVVFADVDPASGLMTPATLAEALARAPLPVSAVLPVHLNGQRCDLAGLAAAAPDCPLIEDACHALGARDESGIAVGACPQSAMATFSLHPVKTITMGEGGVVTTADGALAERVRDLRNHGLIRGPRARSAPPWGYEMHEPGFNYRASDIHCALGRSQLAKLARFVARRQALVDAYRAHLAPLAPWVRPLAEAGHGTPAWHLAVVHIDFDAVGVDRATVMARLHAAGIGSQVHYQPVHHQPYYRQRYGALHLPGADAYTAQALSLPLYPALDEADVARVVAALATALEIEEAKP